MALVIPRKILSLQLLYVVLTVSPIAAVRTNVDKTHTHRSTRHRRAATAACFFIFELLSLFLYPNSHCLCSLLLCVRVCYGGGGRDRSFSSFVLHQPHTHTHTDRQQTNKQTIDRPLCSSLGVCCIGLCEKKGAELISLHPTILLHPATMTTTTTLRHATKMYNYLLLCIFPPSNDRLNKGNVHRCQPNKLFLSFFYNTTNICLCLFVF